MPRLFARSSADCGAGSSTAFQGASGRCDTRATRVVRLGAVVLAAAAATAGCGHDARSTACVPGQSIACAGVQGCAGHQVCKPDGSAYDDCLCGDGGLRPFPDQGPFSGKLGAACTMPTDCRHGLECMTPGADLVGGEGASSGMCLVRCRKDHNFCQEVDATAKCIVLDDAGTPDDTSDDTSYCFPG